MRNCQSIFADTVIATKIDKPPRSGLTVVTTVSPKNFDLVKSRGADAVFDYHDPECARKIKEYTKDSLRFVLDTISTESSYKICAEALPERGNEELHLVALLPLDAWHRKDVNAQAIIAYTAVGEPFTKFGQDFPVIQEHHDSAKMFWALNARLLAEGKIKTHPVTLGKGGLRGIPAG